MGVIQKQAVRTTTVIFAGLGVGIVSRMLMPFILSEEQIGVLALLDSVSSLVSTIFCLGFIQIAIRMFPQFRSDEKGHHGFLLFGLSLSIVGIVLGVLSYELLRPLIFGDAGKRGLLGAFAFLIVPLIVWRILFKNLDAYMRMLYSTVVGAVLESFMLKFVVLLALLLFWTGVFDYTALVYLYVVAFSLPGVVITVLSFVRTPKIELPHRDLFLGANRSNMISYGLFGILASASGILVLTVDQVMMVRMLSVEDVGVYSILFFAGTLVNVPGRGVKRIAMPVLADAWERGDLPQVQDVYKKSSIVNMLSAMFLFVVGWACLDDVLTYLPNYQYGLYVFFFIGLGQLIDMMTGVNMEIIASSDRYRMNTVFNVVLAVLVVVFNLILIPRYGIVGSAMASCAAMVAVNAARWLYLYLRVGLQPFGRNTVVALVVGGSLLALASLVTLPFHPLVNVAVYGVVLSLVYWTIVLKLRLAPDINAFAGKLVRRFAP
ncbi:MAG: lipopolysaccharide biosynthesis protein [Rhodothermales bacterium]|nr:lipopolysaccharide biosynthesis protein [Rhodothermales bacterium]